MNLVAVDAFLYEHSDGYFKNITLGKNADKLNAGGGRVALHYKPTEKWMMRLSSSLDYLNQGGYAYSVYKPEIDSLGDVSYNRQSGYRRLISGTGLTANYTSDKWSLNSQTSFQYIRDDQEVDQDFTANDTYFVTNGIRHNVISEEVTLKSEHERIKVPTILQRDMNSVRYTTRRYVVQHSLLKALTTSWEDFLQPSVCALTMNITVWTMHARN